MIVQRRLGRVTFLDQSASGDQLSTTESKAASKGKLSAQSEIVSKFETLPDFITIHFCSERC